MDEKQKNEATNAVAKANKGFSSIMMVKVNEITQSSGCVLSVKDKTFAQDIILSTYKKMVEENIDPNDINFMGCNFPGQVKRFARLGLSLNENEIWLDIRNNSKTGKKDINLKVQYQGEEKLIIKFCKKNGGVINIIKDVIMEGEELVTSRNFKTGDYIISDHKIPDILHRNINSANKNNVIGAYAIAYHEDGTQTAIVIDKDRIRETSPTPKQQRSKTMKFNRVTALSLSLVLAFSPVSYTHLRLFCQRQSAEAFAAACAAGAAG